MSDMAPPQIHMPHPADFPWAEIGALLQRVREAQGKDAAVEVARTLAAEIDFRTVIPGPLGELVETVDDLAPELIGLFAKIHPFRRKRGNG